MKNNIFKQRILLKITVLLCLVLQLLIFTSFVNQAYAYQIFITRPSDENGPVTPGHSFFISGIIKGNSELPNDVTLRISLFDENGKEQRFAESSKKNYDVIDRFCGAFFYYADDVDPDRSDVKAREFPFLIVEKSKDPAASLRNANIKCWFSDNEFNSFIPYATDVEHGLLINDGIGYTDSEGNPYDALPNGNYIAVATLKDSKGQVLASAKKNFSIEPAKQTILCRFHPDEHFERMMKFAAENNLSMNIDYLPGYYMDRNGNDKGGLRAMFIGNDNALYNGSNVKMVEYLVGSQSSSLTIELPFLEKFFNIDDPERFSVYRYDIGEPLIHLDGRTLNGKLIEVENGDRLCLCRADLADGVSEGYLDFNNLKIKATDTDFSDGIILKVSGDYKLAISGLVVPYQLKDEEILFNPAKNETGLLNRIENIIYIVWNGSETKRYRKPVNLTRVFKDNSVYDSVMEFYHVFSRNEIDPDGEYVIVLYGIDKNGERVSGTKETFFINRVPVSSINGTIKTEGINRYGNIFTGISYDVFKNAGFDEGDILTFRINNKEIDIPFCTDYQDVKRGEPLLVSVNGELSLWTSMGSFAEVYNIAQRSPESVDNKIIWNFLDDMSSQKTITFSMKQKAGYLEEYELRRALAVMKPLITRQPGQTEEEFANFREVSTTGIKKNVLFRSSSPINDRIGRKKIVDNLIKIHGIDHVINLYDSKEEAESIEGYFNSYVSKLDTAYIELSLDYTSIRFREKIADILNYIAENPGKYVIHCVLGEHRTGAVCMILSALMGASYNEIVKDYMLTYLNLYGIKTGTKQYDLLVDDNVNAVLKNLLNIQDPQNLTSSDIMRLATDYVLSSGITEDTLLKAKAILGE